MQFKNKPKSPPKPDPVAAYIAAREKVFAEDKEKLIKANTKK